MSTESEAHPRAEETLRLLAAAAGSARLYPPSSALPAEAVAKFVERANATTLGQGPLRYIVDPDGFRIGETQMGANSSHVTALAKALHALQVGQVVIVPGLTIAEASAFVAIANADSGSTRAKGGVRALLSSAHVSHLAVIEISLRSSDEQGLAGVDLINAPLDDIADELSDAAKRWAQSADSGDDEMARAISRLETATRDIAIERVSTALMRLDERTRLKVLAYSLKADPHGQRMNGMLDVIARLKPAALARLLSLVAEQAGTQPSRIAAAMPLPAETAALLEPLLARPPDETAEVIEAPSALEVAQEMSVAEDPGEIQRQVVVAAPQLSAGRALATAVAVSRSHPDEESVRTIAEVLPRAAKDGAFPTVREALRRLDELASAAELTVEIGQALATLSDATVLAEMCSTVEDDSDAAIVGEILHAAGPAGAEALLETYIRGPESRRSLLRPALRAMSEPILGVARSRLRTEEPARAIAILLTLPVLGDRRAVPVISEALSHLDEQVRFAAITALADTPAPEAASALVKALGNPEPETQRFAVREIGRVKAAPAVHQLTRALEDLNVLQRTYETKKEVIRALEQIGTPEARRALKRTADRGFVWGRKSRELRSLARHALKHIDAADHASLTEGVEEL
jgi:HEAT repeats